MPTYILKDTNSDLSGPGADFDKEVSAGTGGTSGISVEVALSSTEISYSFTPANVPYNAGWPNGTWSVEVDVTTANMQMDLRMRIQRVNSDGDWQQNSGYNTEGWQNLGSTGVLDFTWGTTSWSGGAVGDRIRVEFNFRNNHAHSAQTVVIGTGTTDDELVSPVTEGSPPSGSKGQIIGSLGGIIGG